MSRFTFFSRHSSQVFQSNWGRLYVALGVAVVGATWLMLGHAAPNSAAVEVENGIVGGSAGMLVDSTASGGKALQFGGTVAASGTVSINFNQSIQTIDPLQYGIDETGYPGGGPVLTDDPTEQQLIKALGVKTIRIDLVYATPSDPNSKIQCGGSGCDIAPTGDQWIQAIKAIGAEPVEIVPLPKGTSPDTTDAVNLVKHFNAGGPGSPLYIKKWIIGNESTLTLAQQSADFNADYAAMKVVDPNIQIGGPASPDFSCCTSGGSIPIFLNGVSQIDFVDYHAYGQGGNVIKDDPTLINQPGNYETNANSLAAWLKQKWPTRTIPIQVGEWQLDWDGIDGRFRTQFEVAWGASAMGHILKTGAMALPYGTKNGGNDLGFMDTNNHDALMPIYHGYGMWTGESLFRGFGANMVASSSGVSGLEVYASNNSKNIVAINKNTTSVHVNAFNLTGSLSTSADVWRKDQTQAAAALPVKVDTINPSSGFAYDFPAYSVTTFVLN
jgi:hypothetical protein